MIQARPGEGAPHARTCWRQRSSAGLEETTAADSRAAARCSGVSRSAAPRRSISWARSPGVVPADATAAAGRLSVSSLFVFGMVIGVSPLMILDPAAVFSALGASCPSVRDDVVLVWAVCGACHRPRARRRHCGRHPPGPRSSPRSRLESGGPRGPAALAARAPRAAGDAMGRDTGQLEAQDELAGRQRRRLDRENA